jgi:hypothetical protein
MPTTVISLRANECLALTNPVAGHHRYGDQAPTRDDMCS